MCLRILDQKKLRDFSVQTLKCVRCFCAFFSNSASVFNPRNYLGFLVFFFTQHELNVGVFPLSLSLLLTSFSLQPKIKPEPTLYAKINTLLKYIVSCLHRRQEFPFQMVGMCVRTMTQALAFVVIDQCYFEDS